MGAAGNDPRRSRGLSHERILDEALALVDERGLTALTTRALGQRLGVDPTAVYRHFRNKDELVNALADPIVGSGARPPDGSDADGSPRGQLRSACLALRRALLVHPAMTSIVVRRPPRGTNTWRPPSRPSVCCARRASTTATRPTPTRRCCSTRSATP